MNGEIVPMMAPMMVVQNQHIMQQNPTVHGAHYLPQVRLQVYTNFEWLDGQRMDNQIDNLVLDAVFTTSEFDFAKSNIPEFNKSNK